MNVAQRSLTESTTLPQLLRERADSDPDKKAYVFLNDSGVETVTLTYGELHWQATEVAWRLLSCCRPGDRALLVFPQGPDFIVAYFGCLYAGVVAVPVVPPGAHGQRTTTANIVRDCEPTTVLTVSSMLEPARALPALMVQAISWIVVDQMPPTGTDFTDQMDAELEARRPAIGDIAFLQYTSGSTSDPKGVMVTHGNLVANQRMIQAAFGHDDQSTVVGWAPFFHDQGLIGNVLQPLYVGATSVLMSPSAFIRRPLMWLSAISRYRAHTSGGPNFAFDLCVARATDAVVAGLDLSHWKVAFNGAEPIRDDTVRRFAERFEPAGFTEAAFMPCYGLAEATLLVTAARKGRGSCHIVVDPAERSRKRLVPETNHSPEPSSPTLVGSGTVLLREDVRIIDPDTRRPCRADQIGEIWVAGDHVAQGYWRRPDESAATFAAHIDGSPASRYLRTGDLGAFIDDELFVVGRLKDMVIIRGTNYYPHDIEHTVQSAHPSVRPGGCAAFSTVRDSVESLVVVAEIRGEDPLPESRCHDISFAIRGAVTREHQVTVSDVLLVTPGQLHKTTSGKIMRASARRRYLAGDFECVRPQTSTPDPQRIDSDSVVPEKDGRDGSSKP